MLFILVVLVSCLGLVRVFLSQRRAWALITKVPGPRPLPVVGNMLDVFTFCDSGGYTIPADTTVNIHIFDIHRNSRQFPEPERFDPDRFLVERAALRHTYAYIPFSAGPRNCIGQKFAMLEMKTVMAGLLRRFRLEPITRPEDVIFVSDLVLKSKDPIYVKFTSRK